MRLWECFTYDTEARTGQRLSFSDAITQLLVNPGYRAVVYYRLALFLRTLRLLRPLTKPLAVLILARVSRVPGVEFGNAVEAGAGLFLPHPHDIVIGRGTRIGRNATVYNGVTLGARQLREKDTVRDEMLRYPNLEDDVTVFTGAKVLGPVTIGRGSTVGANAVVLQSCPENSVLVGIPARNIAASTNVGQSEPEESDHDDASIEQ